MSLPELVAILVGGSVVLFVLLNSEGLVDRFNEEMDNFRGGPPTPMHPSPADDGRLLRRRARKSED